MLINFKFCITLVRGLVSRKYTLQSTIALSTTNRREYIALAEVVKESIYLQKLLENLEVIQKHISACCDSQSTP